MSNSDRRHWKLGFRETHSSLGVRFSLANDTHYVVFLMAFYQGCTITIEVPEAFDNALLSNALINKLPGIAIEVKRNSQLLRPKIIDAFVPGTHGLVHDEAQKDYGNDEWHSRGTQTLFMIAEDVLEQYKRTHTPQ